MTSVDVVVVLLCVVMEQSKRERERLRQRKGERRGGRKKEKVSEIKKRETLKNNCFKKKKNKKNTYIILKRRLQIQHAVHVHLDDIPPSYLSSAPHACTELLIPSYIYTLQRHVVLNQDIIKIKSYSTYSKTY